MLIKRFSCQALVILTVAFLTGRASAQDVPTDILILEECEGDVCGDLDPDQADACL